MARIDTSKIEGFAEMSAEEKIKTLTEYEFEVPKADNSSDVEKLKAAISKANADAAEWKRQFREKQTEAERAEAERAESEKAIRDELEQLRREKELSGLIAQYLATGYDQDLARRAAEAMVEGRASDVISIQKEFLGAKQKELAAAEKTASKAQEQSEKLKAEADRLKLEGDRLFGKAKTLEDLERNLEGFLHSVKLVMKESSAGALGGIHGPVSRVIRTSSEYSIAIEIALGGAMQNIVTETDADAKRAIAFLKSRDGGRATFLPMSTIKGRELNETGLEGCRGFVGIASSLCTCDDIYKGILYNLLGRIVVAENLDSAVEIAKKYSYRFRIVTLDGQVVNTGGSLTGGSLAKNTGLLGRASEIENIRAKAKELSARSEEELEKWRSSRSLLTAYTQASEGCRRELAKISEERIKIEAEIKSRRAELDNITYSYGESVAERNDNVKRLEELTAAMNEARRKYDEYTVRISKNEELVQVLSGSKNENARKREKLGEKIQELRIAVLTCEKDIASSNAIRCPGSPAWWIPGNRQPTGIMSG